MAVGYISLEFRTEVRVRDANMGATSILLVLVSKAMGSGEIAKG